MSKVFQIIANNYFSKSEKLVFKIPIINTLYSTVLFNFRRDFRARCLFLFQSERLMSNLVFSEYKDGTKNFRMRYPIHFQRHLRRMTLQKFRNKEDVELESIRVLEEYGDNLESETFINQILYLDIYIFSRLRIFYDIYGYLYHTRRLKWKIKKKKVTFDAAGVIHFLNILGYAYEVYESSGDTLSRYIIFRIRTLLKLLSIDVNNFLYELSELSVMLDETSELTEKIPSPFELNCQFLEDKIVQSHKLLLIINGYDDPEREEWQNRKKSA